MCRELLDAPDHPFGAHSYTMFHFLLPYVEQDAVYRRLSPDTDVTGLAYNTVIKTYICPSDPSIANGMCTTPAGGGNQWAAGCYGGNYYVFGDPPSNRTFPLGAKEMSASIPDGLSNTIFLAEVYGTCLNTGNAGGSLWADSNRRWRPGFNLQVGTKDPVPGYPPAPQPQFRPNYLTGCDIGRAQGSHTGGLLVALGDGTVRMVSPSISPATWQRACDPQDGEVLGSDW